VKKPTMSFLVFWQCPSFGPLMGNCVLTIKGWRQPTHAEIVRLKSTIQKDNKIPERYFVAIAGLMPLCEEATKGATAR
jgi:hypothetical protein